MSQRVISNCQHKVIGTNCKKCGAFIHLSDPVIKTNHYDSYLNCSASKYLKHMRERQCQQIQLKQINETTYHLLQSICQKFQYTIETLALGIYVYAKTYLKQDKDEKFWASASLIVASKGIQLDKRVPYLNRYQRYADKTFSQEDYQAAQKKIFEYMNFDIQFTTFVSFIHFYLTNGFLFKSDSFHPTSLKYVEDDVLSRARDFLKTGEFLHYHPQKLALSIIKEVRIKFRLEAWVKQLETVSGFTQEQIPCLERNNVLKPLNILYHKNKKLCALSLNEDTMQSLQSSMSLTDEKLKSKKGIGFDNTLKLQNIKQNSVKMFQHAPLAILRSNVMSANKYSNNIVPISSEKIVPVNSFINSKRG